MSKGELHQLTDYFRADGWSRYGFRGDEDGLTPVAAAIRAMREFDEFLRDPVGSQAYVAFQHSKLVKAGLVPA